MRRLYAHVMRSLSSSPFPYLAAFVYAAYAAFRFFFVNQFFTTGTTDLRTFFSAFPQVSILVIPALCAALPYRQRDLSYPLGSLSVVCAHFLSLLSSCAVMILLTLTVPVAVTFFGDVEAAQLLCGYGMLLLYTACAASACLFLGTLISHQGAAFLAGALLLAAASFSHLVPLYAALPEFLQQFFRALSFAWHFDAASKGIIDTLDVLFFVAVTAAFLLLSAWVMEKRRGNRSVFFRRVTLLCAAAVVLVLADASAVRARIDTTVNRQFSVGSYSRTVLAEATEPLSITYYRSRALKDLYPQIGDVEEFLRAYADESDHVSFLLVDPAKESATELLERHGIYGQTLDTSGRGSTSYTTVYSAVVISYLGSTETIPFVLDTTTLEYDLTGRIQSLVRGTVRTVQVTVGNSLSLDGDYSYVVPWLKSQGFSVVQTWPPSQCGGGASESPRVPFTALKDVPLLVLGSSQFTGDDALSLKEFIASGGKALVATTPYEVAIGADGDWSVSAHDDAVDLMLMDFGVFFYNSLTADISNFRLTLTSTESADGTPTTERTEFLNYPLWPVLPGQTAAPAGLTSFWPCAQTLDSSSAISSYGSTLSPVLVTTNRAWQVKARDGTFETNPFAVPQSPGDQSLYQTFTLCSHLSMEASGAGEAYVWGDQYALTVHMLGYGSGSSSADFRAYDFLTDTLLRLNGQEEILSLKNRRYMDKSLHKKDLESRLSLRSRTVWLSLGTTAVLLLLLFSVCRILRLSFNKRSVA